MFRRKHVSSSTNEESSKKSSDTLNQRKSICKILYLIILIASVPLFFVFACSDKGNQRMCWDSYDEYILEYPDTQEVIVSACDSANVYLIHEIRTEQEADSIISRSGANLLLFELYYQRALVENIGIEEYDILIDDESVTSIHPCFSDYPHQLMGEVVYIKLREECHVCIDSLEIMFDLSCLDINDLTCYFELCSPKDKHPFIISMESSELSFVEWAKPYFVFRPHRR